MCVCGGGGGGVMVILLKLFASLSHSKPRFLVFFLQTLPKLLVALLEVHYLSPRICLQKSPLNSQAVSFFRKIWEGFGY